MLSSRYTAPLLKKLQLDFLPSRRTSPTSVSDRWQQPAMATAILAVFALLITAAAAATPATAYTNHTVGGASGWLFNVTANTTSTNYSSWAASQTFNLGDFLIFNTNSNQTVIQTYNHTTYLSCNTDDASDKDTIHYGGGNDEFSKSTTVALPLTIEGPNYYFSDAGDGVQCQHGMAFAIKVNRGLGLPPSLNQPPPPPYAEPPPADSLQTPPMTLSPLHPADGATGARASVRSVLLVVLSLCIFASLL